MEQQVSLNTYRRVMDNMDREAIIRFQVIFHCWLKGIYMTPSKIKCLTLLALMGEPDLGDFCEQVVTTGIFISLESARNSLSEIQKSGLIVKNGEYRKTVRLNPDMKIQTTGNIMVDVKMLSREQEPVTNNADD